MRVHAYVEKPIGPVSVRTEVYCLPAPIAVSSLAEVFDPARAEARGRKDSLYEVDGCALVALFRNPTRMTPFLRTREELFTDTVEREARDRRHCVVINGNLYLVTFLGKVDAADGSDPVPADKTTPLGLIMAEGVSLGGQARPMWFFMREAGGVYDTGFGNLPSGSTSGFGGAGPLIINSLPYNSENVYAPNVPAGAPASGPPGAKYLPYLRERSNETFKDSMTWPGTVGKAILAYRSSDGALAVIVQPNGGCAVSMKDFRDSLVSAGFSDAVFVDGSDSVLFYARRRFFASPGSNKNETNTMGIGIRCR